jgi:hypothetical protein
MSISGEIYFAGLAYLYDILFILNIYLCEITTRLGTVVAANENRGVDHPSDVLQLTLDVFVLLLLQSLDLVIHLLVYFLLGLHSLFSGLNRPVAVNAVAKEVVPGTDHSF